LDALAEKVKNENGLMKDCEIKQRSNTADIEGAKGINA
jgi:hypothetical protein